MSKEKLFLLDPYNDNHLKKLVLFEEENNIIDKPSENIKKIKETISSNEIDELLFTEKENRINDCVHIHAEKDIKTCRITPLKLTNKNKRRYLPELATTYALNTLGMEEVFIDVEVNDYNMINYLELKGFENLGEENGIILFLKEREEKENSQRMI